MTAAASPEAALSDAERRQLTIMFCDLVDSVGLSTRLDPEDLRDVIGAYHRACARSIDQYNGYVARYLGDGVLIYFGYPEAHEDDAGRAVRAALDLVQMVARLNDELEPFPDLDLRVRIGVATDQSGIEFRTLSGAWDCRESCRKGDVSCKRNLADGLGVGRGGHEQQRYKDYARTYRKPRSHGFSPVYEIAW